MQAMVKDLKPVRLNYTIGENIGDHEMVFNFDGVQILLDVGHQMPGDVMPISGATLTVKDRQQLPADNQIKVNLFAGSSKVTGVRMTSKSIALITESGGEAITVRNKRRKKVEVPQWPSTKVYRSTYELTRQKTDLYLVAA